MTGQEAAKSQGLVLWDLPEEIVEQILPEIELHRDLVSFACASRLCTQLVIPRHTEYRVLRLGTTKSAHIWAHLSRRQDLASTIREIDIEQVDAEYPCMPSSLIEDVDREERTGEVQEEDMIRALGNMYRLKTFGWDYRFITVPGPTGRHFAPRVFDVLQHVGSVEHFCFNPFERWKFNEPVEECGLWKMSQLRSFVLTTDKPYWPSSSNPQLIVQWLNSLSYLEFLDLPIEMLSEHHAILSFPSLRRFKVSSRHPNMNEVILNFLERHPLLEKLTWFSNAPAPPHLPEHFLPKLRYLDSRFDFFQALTSHPATQLSAPRQFEQLSLTWPHNSGEALGELCSSSGIDRDALRVLAISTHQNSQDAQKIAGAFPMLEELSLPNLLKEGESFSLDEFMLGLERLPHLKVLYRNVVWSDLGLERSGLDPDVDDLQMRLAVAERIQLLARRSSTSKKRRNGKSQDRGGDVKALVRDECG
ncbi:hypothetical protein BDN72DRAFT_964445 [Pluteus cervinus]|uniref:Uncharacterized protein n=1 Tax=Pluteus cervinus TaxID=181527 RepID=A0ACD3AAN3_9AGAR|nr:hypothetical protein BDN72DRAFT_964445 [Pluteus cervinus]